MAAHPFASLADTWSDLRYALRTLRRNPGFTAAAVLILTLAIGANTAVFTVVNAALFKGFRLVDRGDRIVYVHSTNKGQFSGVSYPDFRDWQQEATSFAGGMGLVGDLKMLCDDGDGASAVCDATRITAHGFRLLGRDPMLGRTFVASDDVAGATPVAILSYAFWSRRFGRDPTVVGKTLRLRAADQVRSPGDESSADRGTPPTTIIGVMPEGFAFPQDTDVWVPLVPITPDLEQRDARSEWFAFGRLAPGATLESAQAELDAIGVRLAQTYPATDRGERPRVENFAEFFVDRNAPVIYRALWGAVVFVLLIACANLANLCLARAAGRAREMSIRAAIGAGRWRIVRQLLIESLALSGVGGACGWLVGRWGVRIYALATDPPVGRWNHNLLDYSIDASAFAYVLAVSAAPGVLFGIAPALWLKVDLNGVMKDGARGAASGRRDRRISALLIIAEVSLAMTLVVGAGLMIRSFLQMYTADVGAQTARMASMLLRLPASRYSDRARQAAFYERLNARLAAIPGVESAALGPAPASENAVARTPYEIYTNVAVDNRQRPTTAVAVVGPDYFRTLGTPIRSGREFNVGDRAAAPLVAVVNERFARQQWPTARAVGQRLRLIAGDGPGPWLTIVGVARDVMYDARRQQITPLVYVPYAQGSLRADPWVQVRTTVAPEGVLTALRRQVNRLDPDVVVWLGPEVLRDQIASTVYGRAGHETALLIVFAAIALFLAAVGLYAVVAHRVNERIREIGVRTAMGATARDIRLMVFKDGLTPAAVGLVIGVGAALAVSPVLRSQLVGVVPTDPGSFIAGAGVLTIAATLGCAIPARRATRVDPAVALRND